MNNPPTIEKRIHDLEITVKSLLWQMEQFGTVAAGPPYAQREELRVGRYLIENGIVSTQGSWRIGDIFIDEYGDPILKLESLNRLGITKHMSLADIEAGYTVT